MHFLFQLYTQIVVKGGTFNDFVWYFRNTQLLQLFLYSIFWLYFVSFFYDNPACIILLPRSNPAPSLLWSWSQRCSTIWSRQQYSPPAVSAPPSWGPAVHRPAASSCSREPAGGWLQRQSRCQESSFLQRMELEQNVLELSYPLGFNSEKNIIDDGLQWNISLLS